MEQTTYCQTDVQSIMQRLRGNGNPYTPPKAAPQAPQASSSEINELKTIVKVLGAKLKDATQELSDSKAALISSEQSHQTLRDTIEQLESSLTAKNHDLAAAKNDHRQVQLTIEQLERDCIELRTKNAAPTPSPDLAFMREELLASRADLLKLQEERKQLGAALEHERQKGRSETSNTNGQLVRLAMNCKQLEEEVHSLTCERAATFRQFNQLKELMSASQKELSAEREKIHEREESLAASTRTIQELLNTVEKHTTTITALTEDKQRAAQKEADLLSQIATSNASLIQEKATCEALSTSLKAANESFRSLSLQLEQERSVFHETEEKCTLLQKEKEASDTRVKEVEELLIVKLQAISDLEEQLGEALTRCDDGEHRAAASERHAAALAEELQKSVEARDALHEKALKLEQQLGRTTTENAELKKRTEAYERLKKTLSDASAQAHTLLRTLDPGAKPALSISSLVEELCIKPQERPVSEERFEQHELF